MANNIITADVMISKSVDPKWSQISAHVNRNNKNYTNQNVNLALSHNNLRGLIHDPAKLDERAYGPYVALLRKKAKSQGNLKRAAKNGYDFATHGRRSNQRLMILELGNNRSRKRYFKRLENHGISKDRIRKTESLALVQTAREFDREHKHLMIGAYATNVDETTAHIHCQLIALPNPSKRTTNMATRQQKKQGVRVTYRRPSLSFNKALCEDFPSARNKANQPSSRGAMKELRQSFDKKIVKNFDRAVARYDGVELGLGLGRTGKVNHLKLSEYQAKKDAKQAKSEARLAKHDKAEYTSSLASAVYSSAIPTMRLVSAEDSRSVSAKAFSAERSFANTQLSEFNSGASSFISMAKMSASQQISSAKSYYSASASAYVSSGTSKIASKSADLAHQVRLRFDSLTADTPAGTSLTSRFMYNLASNPASAERINDSIQNSRVSADITEFRTLMAQNFEALGVQNAEAKAKSPTAMADLVGVCSRDIHDKQNANGVKTVSNNLADFQKNRGTAPIDTSAIDEAISEHSKSLDRIAKERDAVKRDKREKAKNSQKSQQSGSDYDYGGDGLD